VWKHARRSLPEADRIEPSSLAKNLPWNQAEVELATRGSKGEPARLGFLMLKTFQRLGYFIALRDVPRSIIEHIGYDQGLLIVPDSMAEYDESGTRRRHVAIIRKYLRVKSFDESGQALLSSTVRLAAARMEDLADIINVAIEELIRHSFELPGFTSLIKLRLVRTAPQDASTSTYLLVSI
jgi:hypothetical protein